MENWLVSTAASAFVCVRCLEIFYIFRLCASTNWVLVPLSVALRPNTYYISPLTLARQSVSTFLHSTLLIVDLVMAMVAGVIYALSAVLRELRVLYSSARANVLWVCMHALAAK